MNKIESKSAQVLPERISNAPAYGLARGQFIAAVGLQLLLLSGMGMAKAYTLYTGKVVHLQTRPVDPWDMFRGDYVRLSYGISQPTGTQLFKRGEQVYVTLQEGEHFWKEVGISRSMPHLTEHQVAIKGKVSDEFFGGRDTVSYGIERYYVPEGTGHTYERVKAMDVTVAVDQFGNAAIKSVDLPTR